MSDPHSPPDDLLHAQAAAQDLEAMTKDQLLEECETRGVEVKTSATKDEILAALRGA